MFYQPCAFTSAPRSFFSFKQTRLSFRVCRWNGARRVRGTGWVIPAAAEISKPTSCSRSCRPLFFLQPKVNWFSAAWNNFARHIQRKKRDFTGKTSCRQAKYALFLSYLLWVTQAICTTPCARKELFVHASLPFFQVLNFEWNLSLQIPLPWENVMISLPCASLKVGPSPPSKDPFVADGFLLIFKPLWRALCVWQR